MTTLAALLSSAAFHREELHRAWHAGDIEAAITHRKAEEAVQREIHHLVDERFAALVAEVG